MPFFSSVFIFFDVFFKFLLYSVCITKFYFSFSAFLIVLNVLVQQLDMTEMEVSVKIQQ